MSFSKKYFIGVNTTPLHLTGLLTAEDLLPKNYYVNTFKKLQDLQTCVDIIESEDIFCGAILHENNDELIFPLTNNYENFNFNNSNINSFVILVEK